jgi:acetyltransferase-like isoleucine patch superfamily enzyme
MAPPIISSHIRIRVPDHFVVGDDSIVDDYCYFSTRIEVGRGSHIANNCSIAGGADYTFRLGDYSSLSAGVRVWCKSNDFTNDLVAIVDAGEPTVGDVSIGNYTGIGTNSIVMPQNDIPEGVSVGALSLVPASYNFEPWTVYAGIPIRRIGDRNRDRVLAQVEALRQSS